MLNAPIVINDDTGAFLMSAQLVSVVPNPAGGGGSLIWALFDQGPHTDSPLSPKEIFRRIEAKRGSGNEA